MHALPADVQFCDPGVEFVLLDLIPSGMQNHRAELWHYCI